MSTLPLAQYKSHTMEQPAIDPVPSWTKEIKTYRNTMIKFRAKINALEKARAICLADQEMKKNQFVLPGHADVIVYPVFDRHGRDTFYARIDMTHPWLIKYASKSASWWAKHDDGMSIPGECRMRGTYVSYGGWVSKGIEFYKPRYTTEDESIDNLLDGLCLYPDEFFVSSCDHHMTTYLTQQSRDLAIQCLSDYVTEIKRVAASAAASATASK